MRADEICMLVAYFGIEIKEHVKLHDEYEENKFDFIYKGHIVGSELVPYIFVIKQISKIVNGGENE